MRVFPILRSEAARGRCKLWGSLHTIALRPQKVLKQKEADVPQSLLQVACLHFSQDCSNLLLNFFTFFYFFLAGKRSKTYLKSLIKLFGFISTDYEAVASHGDPIQAIFSEIAIPIFQYILPNVKLKPIFLFFGRCLEGGRPI